jgi:hypothetical protein
VASILLFFLRPTPWGWAWYCIPVIQNTQEAEVGGLQSKASLGKNLTPCLKLKEWLKW